MTPGVDLDHLAIFTRNIDAVVRRLEAEGLAFSPLTPQSNQDAAGRLVPAGTANRTTILDEGYLEILTPIGDTPLAAQMDAAIERYPGLHLIAYGTDDAQAHHRHAAHVGLAPLPLVHLRRATDAGEARFSVVRLPPGTMPEGRVQLCQHHTPELVWRPELLGRAHGWRRLVDVLVCVADPAATADRHGRLTGLVPRPLGQGLFLVESRRGSVAIVDPALRGSGLSLADLPQPCIPAMAVETDGRPRVIDLRPAARALIELVPPGGRPSWLAGVPGLE